MFPCLRHAFLISFHLLALQPKISAAYSWVLSAPATQCSNLSITITGSDGTPPYSVLVAPFGPTPLPNNTEVRSVVVQSFDGDSTTTSFAINYPTNSQFVAVVSDARGFGTGGTSVATTVLHSGDSSCLHPYSVPFDYFVGADNQFTQCESDRIWWDESTVQGTPSFDGIIPGGQSFKIPVPATGITKSSSEGTGFSWIPSMLSGTTLIVVAGDDRGMGSGGYATFSININNDTSCLTNLSPSSTLGTAAGAYSTSMSASSSASASASGASSSSSQGIKTATLIGAIVGGAVGGLAILAIVALVYFLRRKPRTQLRTGKVIDRDPILSQYSAEPFLATRPTSETQSKWETAYSSVPLLSLQPNELANSTSASGSGGYYRTSEFGSRNDPLTPLEYRPSEFESRNVPQLEVPSFSQRGYGSSSEIASRNIPPSELSSFSPREYRSTEFGSRNIPPSELPSISQREYRSTEFGSRNVPPSELPSFSQREYPSTEFGSRNVPPPEVPNLSRPSEFGSRNLRASDVPSSPQSDPWGVNVIQHEDSGVRLVPPTERRVVELPPRYDNIGAQDRPSLEVLLQSQNLT